MVSMVVRLKIQPGKEADADEAARTVAATVQASEPGVVAYMFLRSRQDPTEMTIIEGYRDQAVFDAHMKQPHVLQFMSRMPQIFDTASVKAGNQDRVAGFTRDS